MIEAKSKPCILLFTFITLIPVSAATIGIGISPSVVKTGDSFSITCTVSDLTDDVIFYKNLIEIGRCAASVIPGLPGLCFGGFTQDITTNITTYSVASANATKDDGAWTCQHPPETSIGLDLTVYGLPVNPILDNQAYLPNSIDTANMDSTQLILNISECVNPAPTISWTFFQDCEGTSISLIPITSTSSEDPDVACSSPYSAYKNTVTVTDMKNKVNGDYCYKVRAFVGYPGTSFPNVTRIFTQNITFTSKSGENSNDNKDGIGLGVGLGVGFGVVGAAGAAGVGVRSKLKKKQASVKSSEKDKTNKNSKKRKSKNKKDNTNADDLEGGRSAAAPDSAGVKADQNSAKEKQNVEYMNEERSNMLKNKDASNVEQKGTHTDDMEHKGTNSNNETKTENPNNSPYNFDVGERDLPPNPKAQIPQGRLEPINLKKEKTKNK